MNIPIMISVRLVQGRLVGPFTETTYCWFINHLSDTT